jgi:hypothetical protein
VIWVAEPGWAHAAGLAKLSDWIKSRTYSIDCREAAGWSLDGIHPYDYTTFGQCADARLEALGFGW